ncbi:hypothetical protein RSO01_47480 [Reyranella soli]|uniref:peptide-methionine (S)-S-oxide reductase n=1 Tax=Reyranella soli TaxID=1230389 RepID=A0A512NF84_9HYPH|nr:peptide-methionine (S)-S-oxide reductase [Reyranella soli]GEP57582.1 hypothetical protein RSO01_47480 [Reyranella soli]
MHQRAVFTVGCFWGMQDMIRKLPGVVSTRAGHAGENPASYKSPCPDFPPGLSASDEPFDYVDTPKLREPYLGWCGVSGFELIAVGAAA